jgi:hypothetical protein
MAQAMKFRKQVEAWRWAGDNEADLVEFCGDGNFEAADHPEDDPEATATVRDDTKDGTWQLLHTGDWVARDSRGRLFPVSDEEMAEAYEPVEVSG